MNIEELSKSQLILLTILVNFVTSVATGILTVSLLDQAPPFVTQTVNRVVERTVETVAKAAPAIVVSAPAPSNQDLVTTAIGMDASRIVSLYSLDAGTSTPAIALGTFLSKARAVITTSNAKDTLPKEVTIKFADNSIIAASLSHKGDGLIIYGFADDAKLPKVSSPTLITSTNLSLGETALAISTDGSASTGIVSRVNDATIFTTLPNIGAGSAAVDLFGNLIGISDGAKSGILISADKIETLLVATTSVATTTPHS